jgi:flagellar hook-length control protein FliK
MLDHTSAPNKPAAMDPGSPSGAAVAAPKSKGAQPSATSIHAKSDEKLSKTDAVTDTTKVAQDVFVEAASDQVATLDGKPAVAAKTPADPDIVPASDVAAPQPADGTGLVNTLVVAIADLTGETVVSDKPKQTDDCPKSEKMDGDAKQAAPDGADDSAPATVAAVAPVTAVAVVTPVVDAVPVPAAADAMPAGNATPAAASQQLVAASAVIAADPSMQAGANAAASMTTAVASTVTPTDFGDDKVKKAIDEAKPQLAEATADPLPAVKAQGSDAPQPAAAKGAVPQAQSAHPHVHTSQSQAAQAQPSTATPNTDSNASEGNGQANPQANAQNTAANAATAAHNATDVIVRPVPSQHEVPQHDAAPINKSTDALPPALLLQTAAPAAAVAADRATPAPAPAVALPVTGIAVEIASKALAGKHSFDIRLDPPELGRIHVRLDVDRNGEISSLVTADRSDTLDLLRRDAPALERALQDAGLKTANNGLQFSLRDHGFGRNDQPMPRTDSARVIVSDESLAAETITPAYRAFSGVRAGVDIRV